MNDQKNVAIVGAGLTGLVTAFYLRRAGITVTLYEKAPRAGGVIQTRRQDGFVWECGPNSGVLGKPEAQELFEDLNGLPLLETASKRAHKRYIWKGKRWEAIPSDPVRGLLTPLYSWRDKLTLPWELFRPRGTDPDENLSSFVRRRLGQSILDYTVDPFVSGVYAGHPDVLIPRYALPKLYALEQAHGGFFRGSIHKMFAPKSERDRKASRKTFSAKGGLQTLVDKLVEAIGAENLRLDCGDLQFQSSPSGWLAMRSGTVIQEHSHLVTATGAHTLPQLVPELAGIGCDAAFAVRYARVAEISIGYRQWNGRPLDGFGGLVPSCEKRDVLGVLFLSAILDGRAPEGGALFAVFAGGLRRPELVDLDDEALRALVAREFQAMMGLSEFSPDLFDIHRYDRAIPQYDLATGSRLAAMEQLEKRFAHLLIGGNGRDGIGMSDRIAQGRKLAERIIQAQA